MALYPMNKIRSAVTLAGLLLAAAWSGDALAFACKDSTGNIINSAGGGGSGTFTVRANLQPSLADGENLVVDLSQSISCRNEEPGSFIDWVQLQSGSAYNGALSNFSGSVNYYGQRYPFPLSSSTSPQSNVSDSFIPWQVQLYLTPISAAQGVVINTGDLIAVLNMHKYSTSTSTGAQAGTVDNFVWNIYANNSVVVPTGGCDVSARNVTVTLPDYPGNADVPLTVHCAKNQNLAFHLTGTTADSGRTIFSNTASGTPAGGIGVQLMRNGAVLATNDSISLGTVGPSPVSLGLTATYARTSGQVTAGNVQSIIGVTFVYQ